MPTPNAIIQQIIRQKDRFLITGPEKVTRLLAELQKQVRRELAEAALDGWKRRQLTQTLDAIERAMADYTARIRKKLDAELGRMWDLGADSVSRPLLERGIFTGFNVPQSLLDTISEFTFHRISGVTTNAFNKIKSELTLASLGTKTPAEAAAAIGKDLNGPGIFSSVDARAETIVKTELGRTFSMAAERRRQQAAKYVGGMTKIWIHAGHPQRPRPQHLAIDGQEVPADEPFRLVDKNGYRLMYPHDPNADISEVINCGCDAITWHPSYGEKPRELRAA